MPAGYRGYGMGGRSVDDLLSPADDGIDPAPILNPQTEADDIHAIRQRLVAPPTEDIVTLNLSPNGTVNALLKRDLLDTPNTSFILTVIQGTIDVYLGDFSSGVPPSIPHARGIAGFPSGQYVLTPKGRVFTFSNPDPANPAQGCAIVSYL